jgi:hypothetical protein
MMAHSCCLCVFFFPCHHSYEKLKTTRSWCFLSSAFIDVPIKGIVAHFYAFGSLKKVENSVNSLSVCFLCVIVPLLMLVHLRDLSLSF